MKITQKDINNDKILVIVEEDDNTRLEDIREKESFKLLQSKVFKNNILILEENYKDEKLNGIYKQYYDNGSIWRTGQYENGKVIGKFVEYRENGDLWRITEVQPDGNIQEKYFDE